MESLVSANELASNGKRYKVGSLPGSSAPFCWGNVVGMAMPLLVALLHAVQSQHAGLASSPCPAAQPACAQLLVLASNARRAKASCAELCNSLPIAHWAIMLSERVQDVPVQTTLVTCKSVPFNCSLQWAIVFFERVEDAQAAKRDLDRQVRLSTAFHTSFCHTPYEGCGKVMLGRAELKCKQPSGTWTARYAFMQYSAQLLAIHRARHAGEMDLGLKATLLSRLKRRPSQTVLAPCCQDLAK